MGHGTAADAHFKTPLSLIETEILPAWPWSVGVGLGFLLLSVGVGLGFLLCPSLE